MSDIIHSETVMGHLISSGRSVALVVRKAKGGLLDSVQLWCMGLIALLHVGSSWIRDQTHVSCISKWILYH